MIKLLLIYKIISTFTFNYCDSCLDKVITRSLKDDKMIIVIPVVIENQKYKLIANMHYVKDYLQSIDSSFSNVEKLKSELIKYYKGEAIFNLNYEKFRPYFKEYGAYIAIIAVKDFNNKKKGFTKEEKNKILTKIAYQLPRPYESFEGKLWQLKPDQQFSKETQNTLFKYHVLSILGDGAIYLYDLCD